uniref:Uncharacterized protein n=1 Tax=Arundo donax TaxID=35708 RepID=A0A0A9DHB5_ARUDO
MAPLDARRRRARRARQRDTGPRRREPAKGPDLPVQRHQESEVTKQYLPRRRPAAPPGVRVLVAYCDASRAGAGAQRGRRALGRVVHRRRCRRPWRGGQLCDAVAVFL